jgi:hypothetical protein
VSEVKATYIPIGRLGNQMFQLAATIGYAKKYNVNWAAPKDTKEVPRFHEFFPGIPKFEGYDFRRFNAVDPSQFNYSEIPFYKNGVKLCGFFQSLKYFEHCQEDVKKVFQLDIKPVDAVSIHVRRTDYVTYENSFPPVTLEYIHQAINKIWNSGFEQKLTKFIIFSDDITWCKDKIKDSNGFTFEFSEGRNELEDLSLMASCSHHIIANSTFSWWGAYLGHNPDKIIVSPHHENWFGPGFTGSAPKDLIPDNWIQIKFR